MDRSIDRRYRLNAEEVRDAILAWLRNQDIPTPLHGEELSWTLDAHGATLEWTSDDTR
jgi:hypothetical protein